MQLPMKLQLLGAVSLWASACRLQSSHFTFSSAHFFFAASHSLRVMALVWSQVEGSVLAPVVSDAAAGARFAGSGVCCAAAIPEDSAKPSAASARVLFVSDMKSPESLERGFD